MVRLLPCGQAKARFVGPDGKPVVNVSSQLEILGTPGPHEWDRRKESQSMLAADAASLPNVDRIHYSKAPFTDSEGRITLPALIPGAYTASAIVRRSTIATRASGCKDFTVKPGEMLELGEIVIEKPKRDEL